MVDIEDRRSADEIPYRLVSASWDTNSVQYHRSVYLCLQGKFEGHINLDDRNNYDLFVSRRKWAGVRPIAYMKHGSCQTLMNAEGHSIEIFSPGKKGI